MMLLQTGGIRSIRLIAFLIPWVAGGHKTFHAKEYQEILGIKKNPCCADVRLAKDYGLICTHRGGKRITYEIQTNPCGTSMEESSATGSGSINKRIQIWGKKENRTERQQMILDALREKFDHGIFTSSLAAKALEIDLDDFRYYIRVLVEQGAVQREWIETHYEYTVMQDVEEEKQAERIREHLAHKYLISSETTEASYTETAAAG